MRNPYRHVLVSLSCILLSAALTEPLRAQSCNAPPLFDLSGPSCSSSRQSSLCGCSECLTWDPAAGATWYEVRRCSSTGTDCLIVGDTRWKNRAGYTATMWCAPWDDSFPTYNTTYLYSVRSCKDSPSGPVCATALSNTVAYKASPYMCVENGLEIPCLASTSPSPGAPTSDTDGDGITDAVDPDDDGDLVFDVADNCPVSVNVGQRDADRDGTGDVCDEAPTVPDGNAGDTDHDGIADGSDVCPMVYDPMQADTDADRTGDACDNCPVLFNTAQTDSDDDGQGDRCDLDDGTIYAVWTRTKLSWVPEAGFDTWCSYRGDLAELRRSGTYTQQPGSNPLAAQVCNFVPASIDDVYNPAVGAAAFYLVAGRPGPYYAELGVDSEGHVRPNAHTCP